MIAIISSTTDDKYLFSLPITAYCWAKLGVDTIIFMPMGPLTDKSKLVLETLTELKIKGVARSYILFFNCPKHKEPTYSQCVRLFGGCLDFIDGDEILITSDADMAIFSKDLTEVDHNIHIWGNDLVPQGQFPICFCSMSAAKWKEVFNCGNKSFQEMLDEDLGPLDSEHMRSDFWARDQELLHNAIMGTHYYIPHPRAYPNTQFASRRLDRDDGMWETMLKPDTIDCHLWRPGYEPENFSKIMRVLRYFYPQEDFSWLVNYRQQYDSIV